MLLKVIRFALLLLLTLEGCSLRPSGKVHRFQIGNAPLFLTEQMAIEKARQALILDGHTGQWQPSTMDQSTRRSPDGARDRYLIRFQPTYGRISFIQGQKYCTYDVALRSDTVVCQRFFGL